MTIVGKPVTVGEFMSIYQKNNVKGEAIDKKSMDEYLDFSLILNLRFCRLKSLGSIPCHPLLKSSTLP